MATWRIGIDEAGLFNALDPHDHSYVCAVITQKTNLEIESSFENIYKVIKGKAPHDKMNLLKFFHGCEQGTNRNDILHKLLKENLFFKSLKCSDKPVVFANNQQWWLSCVLGLIKKINSYDFIKPADILEIVIDCRKDICLGFFSKEDVDTKTLQKNFDDKILLIGNWEKTNEPISSKDFDSAFSSAVKATTINRTYEKATDAIERLLKMKQRRVETKENAPDPNWSLYHRILKGNLELEIRKIAKCDFSVSFASAKRSPLVALADQIGNMQKWDFQKYISENNDLIELANPDIAHIQNLTYGQDVDEYVRDGDYLEACDILLTQIFSGKYEKKEIFNTILAEAKDDVICEIWRKIFHACDVALKSRGLDGNAIQHIEQLVPILYNYEENIPNSNLRINYLKLHTELVAHSGKISNLKSFNLDELLASKACEFSRDTERWNFYVEASAIQAQIFFNAYDFNCIQIEKLLKTQEQFASIKYPFYKSEGNHVDENAAMLYGTIGQASAFTGNLDKAALYFDRDYRHASEITKNMPASFLTIVYHREENLEKAKTWFEKECNVKFENFGKTISQNTDQWFILNYFRLYALSLKKGINNLPEFPEKELWERKGEYPWPLLLKWAAYSMEKLNKIDNAIDYLQASCQILNKAQGFTVRTLALAPMAMLVQIFQKYHKDDLERYQLDYRNSLERLCDESPTFAKYIDTHPEIAKAVQGTHDLWDAAMILPFNYA